MLWNRDESRWVVHSLSRVRTDLLCGPGRVRDVDVDLLVL